MRERKREWERVWERETCNDIITCIARADSRFSANEEILVENISEGSLVARRIVFDGIMNESSCYGSFSVDVNRNMLKFVGNAHSQYVKQLEKQKSDKL